MTPRRRKLTDLGIPNLSIGLVVGQILGFVATMLVYVRQGQDLLTPALVLIPDRVLQGEAWRIVSFLIVPPSTNILICLLFWLPFLMMGQALEAVWGRGKYTLYLLVGLALTTAASFLAPQQIYDCTDLVLMIFFAFSFAYPDFQFALYFLIPIRAKWLALITGSFMVARALMGGPAVMLQVLAVAVTFALFFAGDLWRMAWRNRSKMAIQVAVLANAARSFRHRCCVCGLTDAADPQAEFRYCTDCHGTPCYCARHLNEHQHVR